MLVHSTDNMAGNINLAAYDAILDFVRALDANDERAVAAELHDDFIWDQSQLGTISGLPSQPPIEGKAAVTDFLKASVLRLDTACHISNMRTLPSVGGSGRTIICYATTHHFRPGEALLPDAEGFVAGSEYTCEVKQSKLVGSWKLRKFTIRPIWCKGDMGVFGPPPDDAKGLSQGSKAE